MPRWMRVAGVLWGCTLAGAAAFQPSQARAQNGPIASMFHLYPECQTQNGGPCPGPSSGGAGPVQNRPVSGGHLLFAHARLPTPGTRPDDEVCIVWAPGEPTHNQSLFIPKPPREANRPFYNGLRYDVDPENQRLTITELSGQDGSLRSVEIVVPLFDTPGAYWPCASQFKTLASGGAAEASPVAAQRQAGSHHRSVLPSRP
jgi:hypothetical protein